jgi:putative SOS response-associated peptidase YedK
VIITTDANAMLAEVHERLPLILVPKDYARRLSDEPDPRDLMQPFPAEPMPMWPIATRVDKPEKRSARLIGIRVKNPKAPAVTREAEERPIVRAQAL